MDAISKIRNLWDTITQKERRDLVHYLFEYIIYDLDTRRIVDFRLKAWADRFLVLRSALYVEKSQSRQDI